MNEFILSLAMAVAGPGGQLALHNPGSAEPRGTAFRDTGGHPAQWRSIASGALWTIRKDGDALYLDRLLSDDALRDEHSTSLELHLGKKGYKGTERQVIGGAFTDQSGREVTYKCVFEWPAEAAAVTESRVEIRVLSPPDNARIDFRKCAVEKTRLWHTAVWIPE